MSDEKEDYGNYFEGEAERLLLKFDSESLQIGPKNRNWVKRVKLEMKNISVYLNFLKDRHNALWFFLSPVREKKFNFRVWEGQLKIPSRPDIVFDMVIVLTSEYPKVFPRCFVEEKIIKYAAGNLYIESRFNHKGKSHVMLCHDHMKDLDVWTPNLSISHFLLQEILIWWNSKINTIMRFWDNPELLE